MKEWFIANLSGLATGFVVGWLFFKRPDLITAGINWIRSKLHI